MPLILFTRTPSIAEGGPGHPFREGAVHDVAPRSARRWLDIGCAVPAPADPDPLITRTEIRSDGAEPLAVFQKLNAPVSTEAMVELVEAGGEAPPKPARQLRHAASGRWHVWEGETRLTERALPRPEAEALAAETGAVLDA